MSILGAFKELRKIMTVGSPKIELIQKEGPIVPLGMAEEVRRKIVKEKVTNALLHPFIETNSNLSKSNFVRKQAVSSFAFLMTDSKSHASAIDAKNVRGYYRHSNLSNYFFLHYNPWEFGNGWYGVFITEHEMDADRIYLMFKADECDDVSILIITT